MKAIKVGIVGGAGQVGSALLKGLSRDVELMAFGICRNSVSAARVASEGLQVRVVPTRDTMRFSEATRDLDILVNCALPQYAPSKTSAENHLLANSLAAACAGKHLVHLSSVAVYGDFIPGHQALFDYPKPDNGYGRQKLQMEQLLRSLAKKHSVKCTILRVGHVYGPQLRWSEAMFDLLQTDDFRLPFDGQIPSNGVAITNLIEGIRKVLVSEPLQSTINLVDAPQTTWRTLFDLHAQACGRSHAEPLNTFDSQRLAWAAKQNGQAGLSTRFIRETWDWVKHLPASYIASVPAFKAIVQRVVAGFRSETLDARLWALYSRRFSLGVETRSGEEITPLLFSEPVPGPCLSYEGHSPAELLSELKQWHRCISTPGNCATGDLVLNLG